MNMVWCLESAEKVARKTHSAPVTDATIVMTIVVPNAHRKMNRW